MRAGLPLARAAADWLQSLPACAAGASHPICNNLNLTLAPIPNALPDPNTKPAVAQVRPGPAWRGLLLAPEAADWLLGLLPALRGAAAMQPLARGARQLLARPLTLAHAEP